MVANHDPSGCKGSIPFGGVFTMQINLIKGNKYKLCTCGASKKIPFCDDSHRELNDKKGTSYKSLKITPKEDINMEVSSSNWES